MSSSSSEWEWEWGWGISRRKRGSIKSSEGVSPLVTVSTEQWVQVRSDDDFTVLELLLVAHRVSWAVGTQYSLQLRNKTTKRTFVGGVLVILGYREFSLVEKENGEKTDTRTIHTDWSFTCSVLRLRPFCTGINDDQYLNSRPERVLRSFSDGVWWDNSYNRKRKFLVWLYWAVD